MSSFSKTNLQNIKDIFEEKTGVELASRRRLIGASVLMAAVMVCCLTMTAFAASLFSSLDGDDLSLSATYEGNGLVSIQIENRSNKNLSFQPQLRLMQWSTAEEIVPTSGKAVFSGTEFRAHTSGVMTVDLSQAYNMDVLEQPLTDDHYYLVLTNNNFVFGQDWMCSVSFAEPIKTVVETPPPIPAAEADRELAAQIMEELRPYFETYPANIDERREAAGSYLQKCQELLNTLDRDVIPAVEAPWRLTG